MWLGLIVVFFEDRSIQISKLSRKNVKRKKDDKNKIMWKSNNISHAMQWNGITTN